MKLIHDLNLGFTDAQNYTQRQNKSMFNDVFVKNIYLDELLKESKYFLIGEKGTGKTAYAAFLSNGDYKDNKSLLKFLSATDYEKFYTLKKQKNLDLTGYASIWKVILLLVLSMGISENDKVLNQFNRNQVGKLLEVIDHYYASAFSPEIMTALKVVDESEVVAKLISNIAEVGGKKGSTFEFTETKFQTNLLYIERQFSEAIKKLKLNKNIILFIDGIDVRPDTIPYKDYLECIRGLVHACWLLNTELFQNVKDSKGHFRVVLLLRPDIYGSLNLQNATNKLLDNSVFLDWRTTYGDYKTSYLYKVSQNILAYNQNLDNNQDPWDFYFPWRLESTKTSKREYDTAFMAFLRICLSRPRDILAILSFMQKKMIKDGYGNHPHFLLSCYESDEFQNNYSEYFMSSLKDQLSFYYSSVDFEHFLKFFNYFQKKEFYYPDFKKYYDEFTDYICDYAQEIPAFVEDPLKLLQLLYDCNVIVAIENKTYFHYSYREKSNANIEPKVPKGNNVKYRFHYGMYKKTKFGRF